MTITRDVVQLNPALLVSMVTMFSAWKSRSPWLQRPGTTMIGVRFPSSALNGLPTRGSSRRLRSAASGPVPNTMASYVRSEPVMWSVSTPGWLDR